MTTNNPRRRRALRAAAPVAGLLAAGLLVWQGSYAAFSATTDNTNNAWTTGSLTLTNNGGTGTGVAGTGTYQASTAALFTETGLAPTATPTSKCLTVNSGGSLAGALKLYRGAISGTNGTALATALTVTVNATVLVGATANVPSACTGFTTGGTSVYSGSLNGLGTTYATGTTAMAVPTGNQRIAYRITYQLPAAVTDNTLQSSTAQADLVWEIQ